MPKGLSAYLNLMRVAAALAVLLAHASYVRFGGSGVYPEHLAHEAVVVFFVLSGYVIAYVATQRERSGTEFLISRAARIYSVALPALALTAMIDVTLHLSGYQIDQPWKYLPVFLTFTTDVWFLNIDAFSDAPYWSLCYEVWYYLIFAAAIFLTGRVRVAAIILALAVVGPRVWLLFPVWLAGVLVFRTAGDLSRNAARAALVLSLIVLLAVWSSGLDYRLDLWVDRLSGGWAWSHLRYSRYFLGDWLTGALIAVNVYAARGAELEFGAVARVIAWAAGFSFTLYLVHFPVIEFMAHYHVPHPALAPAAVAVCWVVSLATERQKTTMKRLLMRLATEVSLPPDARPS